MEIRVGRVNHYYNHLGVAVIEVRGELKIGDKILILGHTTDFEQRITSMEIEHQKVARVGPGCEVALRVEEPVRSGDEIYRIVEPETTVDNPLGLL